MNTEERISEIKELTKKLNVYRDEYYNKSRPSVDDATYDKLVDKLKQLEDEADFHCVNSPNYTVGYVVNTGLPKVRYSTPLLSLDKTKDPNVAETFTKGKAGLLMHKLDGLTICLTYENGILVEAGTRGNGEEGSLITDNAKTFMNVPEKIPYKNHLRLTGEGIIHKNDFERINQEIPNKEDRYKTPRNLAGGSVQQLDSGICAKRCVYFYCFDVLEGFDELAYLSDKLDAARKVGFDVVHHWIFDGKTTHNEFSDKIDEMVSLAESQGIPIDGLVVKYNNIAYGKSLGKTGHHYRNGIALKFKEEEEITTIRDIEWQVGRTGKITPVAIFNPVTLDNTTVSKASLHNISTMEKLKIKPHSEITVIKANEIIPQIIKCVGGTSYDFEIPHVCPVCGGKTTIVTNGDTKALYCKNRNCSAQNIRAISYFCSKDGMNIDGLSDKIIEKFVELGFIEDFWDIYMLADFRDEIIELEGFGEKSCDKLLEAISKSRNVKLENFITALGIPTVALSKAKIISRRFHGSWGEFENAIKTNFDFTTLDSFGTEINKNIYQFFNEVFFKNDTFTELANIMNFQVEEEKTEQQIFDGMIFAITGTVNIFKSRKEIQKKIESLGGKVSGSVSKKTAYLINNDAESSSSKNRDAKNNNVPIITEEQFLKLLENNNKGEQQYENYRG